MTRALRNAICFLFIAFVVSSTGIYASWNFANPPDLVSSAFSIGINEFSYEPPKAVYITNVELAETTEHASNHTYSFSLPAKLSMSLRNDQSMTSVTYKITVYNNTDVSQWYTGMFYDNGYGTNSLFGTSNGLTVTTKDKLADTSKTFNTNDYVPPHTYRDFYATYSFGSNALWDISTLVEFKFDIRMDSVYDGFLAILNNRDSYEILSDAFDDAYSENETTALGNVGQGSTVFDALFGENMTINVDGVDVPVTVMVERSNVDGKSNTGDNYDVSNGPTGCEYTVYITVNNAAGQSAAVYAISYSQSEETGEWYQIGELYEGTATLNADGTINLDDWEATANTYTVGTQISYKVGYEQGTEYDKHSTIEEIMSSKDQEIFNKIDNSGIFKKAYDIIKANNNSTSPEVELLREAFEDAAPYYHNYNNGQEFKVNRNYTRAELLPALIKIQNALDYYYQVHE